MRALRSAASWRAVLAAVIGLVVLVGYVWLMSAQGPNGGGGSRELFFVAYWLALAIGAIAGGTAIGARPTVAQPILLAVGIGYLATGFLAMFSVGMPLLVAGLLALSAAGSSSPRWTSSSVGIVLPLVVLALGLGLTG